MYVEKSDFAVRLTSLRAELKLRALRGILIPKTDAFQNEYIPASEERLAYISGFTGSAGMAVVLDDVATVLSDGRYVLQLAQEVDSNIFECRHIVEQPVGEWLKQHLKAGDRLGYDPWLLTKDQVKTYERWTKQVGAEWIALDSNPIDVIWKDRPQAPASMVNAHPVEWAGQTSAEKIIQISDKLDDAGIDVLVVTAVDSIVWLLNVRATDTPHTPLALSRLLLHRDGKVQWFIDLERLASNLLSTLPNNLEVLAPELFGPTLIEMVGKKVWVDPAITPVKVLDFLKAAVLVERDDPCQLPKACKNAAELKGVRNAHRRDGLALVKFLHWLDVSWSHEPLDELKIADKLAKFRAEQDLFQDLSFDTIAGFGPNGAIIHYRANPQTNLALESGNILLLDSGGQYLDGTTDVTRTIALGKVSEEVKRCYTLVLKGHIALAQAVFPKGTTGSQLDSLARQFLWQAGLDYDHGTGHGVGAYLSVHEGPQRISKLPNRVALQPGMILSNEPGYYRPGHFGIRIENLVCVIHQEIAQAEREMMAFETLTLVPIDQRLIQRDLLTVDEISWLNHYHRRVFETHAEHLTGAERDWLAQACAGL